MCTTAENGKALSHSDLKSIFWGVHRRHVNRSAPLAKQLPAAMSHTCHTSKTVMSAATEQEWKQSLLNAETIPDAAMT